MTDLMDTDEASIARIVASPADEQLREEYARWLAGRGDLRAGYLRAELEWARTRAGDAEAGLRALAVGLDPVWVARVSRPPVGVCADHLRFLDRGLPRPQLSPSDLDWVETRFHLTLPADYRAYLLNHNGACPEPAHLRIPGREYGEGCYDQVTGLHTLWTAGDPETDRDDDLVWRLQFLEELRSEADGSSGEAERWRGEPHRHWAVIGAGAPTGELEWLCLACGGDDFEKVFFAAPYLDSAEEEDYCPVAPSFAAFLGMLTDYDPEHVKAVKSGDVAALRRWLAAGGDPDTLYHNTPLLEHAVFACQPATARELLAHGARVYDRTRDYARGTRCQELIDLLGKP